MNPVVYGVLDALSGPHYVDRFASCTVVTTLMVEFRTQGLRHWMPLQWIGVVKTTGFVHLSVTFVEFVDTPKC